MQNLNQNNAIWYVSVPLKKLSGQIVSEILPQTRENVSAPTTSRNISDG